jgi:hypothetical protein
MLQHTECVPISEDIKLACRMITVPVVTMPDHGTSVQQIKFVVYKKSTNMLRLILWNIKVCAMSCM